MKDRDPASVRLGGYLLPNGAADVQRLTAQASTAELCGLHTAWISERWGNKDFVALAAAAGQATTRIRIGVGVTHLTTRHPVVLASSCMTLQALTGGRLILGVGRSIKGMWASIGLPVPSTSAFVDLAGIIRRLCHGERVSYDGPAGQYPALRLSGIEDLAPPPMVLAGVGPRSLELAGQHFDGVLLHPFLTPDGVERSAKLVRAAASAAGRDPQAVVVYAAVVVAPDLPAGQGETAVRTRAVSYFQSPGLGEALVHANGWDPGPLQSLRAHPRLTGRHGIAGFTLPPRDLVAISDLLPQKWFSEGAAIGSTATCAQRLCAYVAAGVDELALHGTEPELLGPLLNHVRSDLLAAS